MSRLSDSPPPKCFLYRARGGSKFHWPAVRNAGDAGLLASLCGKLVSAALRYPVAGVPDKARCVRCSKMASGQGGVA
jgi:hypothetical protein